MSLQVRRTPSGLLPMGPRRPTLREPTPVRSWAILAGLVGGGVWLLAFGQIAGDLAGYAWWTLVGGLLAWVAAIVLARFGDRGAAAGISLAVAIGWSTTAVAIVATWANSGDWPMW
ncbi:hypothetical protein F4553_004551 [Allocatelliglobosispora scoriae]|uniref:Uncharacterized protein n=1 Tax=Allocatelliglobosispora scoriae TaxID=643052 RepID=A0A841BWN1_9ACTN|nr:hypothetical protein [Allocatelliglobosispora scoriae]MBB5871172.1 hypothetical protein [Allocatelliglobosispora scoriae]